jgi:predicted DNA repair protein MutK
MEIIYKIFLHAIMITGFVFIMMLMIEYINVQSKGLWQKSFTGNKWRQYIIAGILGAIPDRLGAFTMVAMFSHRLVSFGALVTTMIATSGDEDFLTR